MSSPFARLRERKLVQWSVAYLAGAWVLLEILAFATSTFGWPLLVVRTVTVLALFGLAGVVVVAWFHGSRGEQRVSPLEAMLLLVVAVSAAGATAWLARPRPAELSAAVEAAPLSSVAVLPFANMSGRAEEEYFSDGVTEEILNALAQVPGLRVAARTSSFAFKGDERDVREIATSLGVRAVLEGSVRRDGDRIRVTGQLIDAGTGYHLWSNTFERPAGDLFGIQHEIAQAIANALEIRLTDGPASVRPPTRDPVAHDLYLRGREAWNERTKASLAEAIALFRQAVARDPGFALAYSGLADSYGLLEDYGGISPEEAFPLAIEAARHALEIDETLAEAHASLGHVYMHQLRWDAAEQAYRDAIRHNPSYANAHHWYSLQLMWLGRHDEALRENRIARELDPLSEKIEEAAGLILFYGRGYEEASTHLEAVVRRRPGSLTGHQFLAFTRSRLGLHDGALASLEALERAAGEPWLLSRARVLAEAGAREEARAALDEALRASPELRRTSHNVPAILALLGEEEEALAAVEEATPSARLFLAVDPAYDRLRHEPRFQAQVTRMGLPALEPRSQGG